MGKYYRTFWGVRFNGLVGAVIPCLRAMPLALNARVPGFKSQGCPGSWDTYSSPLILVCVMQIRLEDQNVPVMPQRSMKLLEIGL